MTLRAALADLDGLRFVTPSDREEQVVTTAFEASSIEAETVGGVEFVVTAVPEIGRSEFTHFLDGAQRSWQLMFRRLAPVYAAHTSGAVLERIDGEIQPPSEATYSGALEAFVPDDLELADKIRPFVQGVVQARVKDQAPGGLEDLIRKTISDRRDELERDLAQRFTSTIAKTKLLLSSTLGS